MHEPRKENPAPGAVESQHHVSPALARDGVERLIRKQTPIGLFLDIDGTLLEMALTPSTVHVPPGLAELLGRVTARLAGAMAIVTGRPIAEADALLQPLRFIAAGVHGAEIRTTATGAIQPLTASFSAALLHDIQNVSLSLPGIVTEDKGAAIALHYRLAPELRDSLLITLEGLAVTYPGQFEICEGRKVVEILPVGFSKGRALRTLASLPEFASRVPIMIGDDIADIGAFRAAENLGGFGLKVAGENFSVEEAAFTGPRDVLGWLAGWHTMS